MLKTPHDSTLSGPQTIEGAKGENPREVVPPSTSAQPNLDLLYGGKRSAVQRQESARIADATVTIQS